MALPPHVARSARRIAEALGVPGDSAVVADALDLLERAGVQPGGGMNGRCVIGAALKAGTFLAQYKHFIAIVIISVQIFMLAQITNCPMDQ